MGALHKGHMKLVNRAKKECDILICSIYVNPAQFNNKSDLLHYPRNTKADLKMLRESQCDVAFIPSDSVMYPKAPDIKIGFGQLESILEGYYRPNHFAGVGLVVSKLFNIVHPDKAFFGLKDLQQCLVIEKLVKELAYPVKLVFVPTVRETSGLAYSSRNRRLSEKDLMVAPMIYRALKVAKSKIRQGKTKGAAIASARSFLSGSPIEIEYIDILDLTTYNLAKKIELKNKYAICIAAYLNGIRLIDNIFV